MPRGVPPTGRKPNEDGNNTKYRPEYCELAYKFCLLGAKDIDLADLFKVTEKTIIFWKDSHPEFLQAINEGKHIADAKVAESLYNRACGAKYKEQVAVKVKKGQYEEEVQVVEVERSDPPDTNAARFWLTNRQRNAWRNSIQHTDANAAEAEKPQQITFKMDRDIEKEERDE